MRCKAHFLWRGPLSEASSIIVWGAGKTGRRLSKHLMREGAKIEAFIDIDPTKIGRSLRGVRILSPDWVPQLHQRGAVVLAAVGSRGARQLIRERLVGFGLEEGTHFWCVS